MPHNSNIPYGTRLTLVRLVPVCALLPCVRQKRTLERLLTSGGRLNFVCGVGRLLERLLRCVGALRRLSVFSLKIRQNTLKKFLFNFFRAYGANIVITLHVFRP